MTEEKLDFLLDLATEQYAPSPMQQEKLRMKLMKPVKSAKNKTVLLPQSQSAAIMQSAFALFDRLMQTI